MLNKVTGEIREKFLSEQKTDQTRIDNRGTKKEVLQWLILAIVRKDKIENPGQIFFQEVFGRGPKN